MATHVGNTTEMYGHKYNIVVTNVCGPDLLKATDLAERALIISSQANANKEDLGITSLFMTDYDGKPIRLTYTIALGNGLMQGEENEEDVIRLGIDNVTVCSDYLNGNLYVNKGNLIDNDTLKISITSTPEGHDGRIKVITKNLTPATNLEKGIVKADEFTTYINPNIPGEISVYTANLDTVDDILNRDGIIRHNSEGFRTIEATDGRLNVVTYNLDKASATSAGIVQGDNDTIFINEQGVMRVVTENLDKADKYYYGIVKADNNTISIDDGVLTVETANLAHATMESFGIIRPSQWCFDINSYDCLEVKNYADIERLITENWPEHEELWKEITDLKNRVSKLETTSVHEMIEVFEPAGTLSTILKYPERDNDGNIIEYKDKRTIPFKIKTNCKFNAKVDWVNNENPQIKLLYVKYKDNIIVNENELYNTIFENTDNEIQTIEFTFEICNYNRDNNISGLNTNAVISVASINNSAVKQVGHHTFTRWNNLAWIDEEKITIEPPVPVEEPLPDTKEELTISRVFIENTEKLSIYSGTESTITNNIIFGNTGSKKFYLTGTVDYKDIDSEGNLIKSGTMDLSLSETAQNYPIFIAYKEEEYKNGAWIEVASTSFNKPEIISTYATTGKNNVLSVSSKTPISAKNRRQRIAVSFGSMAAANAALSNNAIRVEKTPVSTISVRNTLTSRADMPSDILNIDGVEARLNTVSSVSSTTRKTTLPVKKIAVTSVDLVRNNRIEQQKYLIDDAVDELVNRYNETYVVYKNNITNPDITRERKERIKLDFNEKVLDITDKYVGIIRQYDSVINTNANVNSNYSSLVLIYEEKPTIVEKPTVNVVANILAGAPYIRFTVTRSKNSVLDTSGKWRVYMKYLYINSNGLVVPSGTGGIPLGGEVFVEGNTNEYSKSITLVSGNEITTIMNLLKNNSVSSITFESSITNSSYKPEITTEGFLVDNNYKIEITSSVVGTWPITPVTEKPKETFYSFGNAKIVSVRALPWDDSELILEFKIQGGSTTNIPDGMQISEMVNSSNGKTNFIFTIQGNTYKASDIYWGSTAEANGYCKFGNYDEGTKTFHPWTETGGQVYWKNNQCTVYYKLYTNYQEGRGGNYNIERKFYLKTYGYQQYYNQLATVYLEDRIFKGEQNILNFQQRDYMCINVPLVPEISAIQFWIGLIIGPNPYQSAPNVQDKFESSSSSLSNKIIVNFNFAIGGIQQLSIVNASTVVSR